MNPFPDTITDIHTHNRQCGDWAILSVNAGDPLPPAPAFLSSGLHPWHTVDPDAEERMAALENTAVSTRITAIGECGLDRLRGADIKRQEQLFARHILLSEQLRKPMIIHCVRAFDRLLHMPREYRPRQLWIVHGFRGKPQLASQLIDNGIAISLGERFNPQTANIIPEDHLFFETDESLLPIQDIKSKIISSMDQSHESLKKYGDLNNN